MYRYTEEEKKEIIDLVERSNEFPIGSPIKEDINHCPVKCIFCYENMIPPELKKIYTFPLMHPDDFKEIVDRVDKFYGNKRAYYVGSRWSDMFCNPNTIELIRYAMDKYKNKEICLSTTGTLLNEKRQKEFVKLVNEKDKMIIQFSLITLNEGLRERYFKISNYKSIDYLLQHIDHGRNEVWASLNAIDNLDTIDEDLDLLVNKYKVKHLALRATYHTKYATPFMKKISKESVENYPEYAKKLNVYRDKIMLTDHFMSDLDTYINSGYYEKAIKFKRHMVYTRYLEIKKYIKAFSKNEILFCSSPGSYDYWFKKLEKEKNVKVICINNYTYGGNYNCSGMMVFPDVIQNIKENKGLNFDTVFLPKEMIKYYVWEKDYFGNHVDSIEKELGQKFIIKFL